MHESLVGVLNRRFVNCYFNSFNGPGADPTALELFKELEIDPKSLRYGAIITPEGEFVNSFGFSQDEFYRKIVSALEANPELAKLTEQEEAIIERAKRRVNIESLLAGAQVHLELLDFDAAEEICNRFLRSAGGDGEQQARMQAMLGHIQLLDLRKDRRSEARDILSNIKLDYVPPIAQDIADDIAIDLIACDVSIAPSRAFYGGWQMDEAVAEQHAQTIELWLERDPNSNRRGEMLFYLGLARLAMADQAGANKAWRRHADELPEDRFAMLSRLHHSEYVFSPTGKNKVIRSGGRNMIVDTRSNAKPADAKPIQASDPKLAELLNRIAAMGGSLEIRGDRVFVDGKELSEEDSKLLIKGLFSGDGGKIKIDSKPKKDD